MPIWLFKALILNFVFQRLQSAMQGECLQRLAAATWPDVATLGFGGPLRHFVCKLTSAAQYTTSRWTPPYNYNAPTTPARAKDNISDEAKESIISAVKQRQQNLLRAYRVMHKNLHSKLYPTSCIFQASDTEAMLASVSWRILNSHVNSLNIMRTLWTLFLLSFFQVQGDYEVYMTLEPLVSKQEAFEILKKLTKWISSNKQRLFILSSPTF